LSGAARAAGPGHPGEVALAGEPGVWGWGSLVGLSEGGLRWQGSVPVDQTLGLPPPRSTRGRGSWGLVRGSHDQGSEARCTDKCISSGRVDQTRATILRRPSLPSSLASHDFTLASPAPSIRSRSVQLRVAGGETYSVGLQRQRQARSPRVPTIMLQAEQTVTRRSNPTMPAPRPQNSKSCGLPTGCKQVGHRRPLGGIRGSPPLVAGKSRMAEPARLRRPLGHPGNEDTGPRSSAVRSQGSLVRP